MPRDTDGISAKGEPILKAPWPVVALALGLVALYAVQALVGTEPLIEAYGFSRRAIASGRGWTVVTALLLHGGWLHVGMNALAIMAFGAPPARLFGQGPRGGLTFLMFFLATGVLGNLGFLLVSPGSDWVLAGASGGASGLMGMSVRMMGGRGTLGPVFSRQVLGFAAVWGLTNLVLGMAIPLPGVDNGGIAWQAHLFGFAAGVLLAGPFRWLSGNAGAITQ